MAWGMTMYGSAALGSTSVLALAVPDVERRCPFHTASLPPRLGDVAP